MRPLLTVALFLASAILAPMGEAADRAPSKLGFLFATRAWCGQPLCPAQFHTTLLVIDGDKMRVAVSSPHFYVPRKSGFWELGVSLPRTLAGIKPQPEQNAKDNSAEFVWQLWAAPLGAKPDLPLPPTKDATSSEQTEEPSDESDELRELRVTWAGTDYLSLDEQIGEYSSPHLILRIDDIAHNKVDSAWTPKLSDAEVSKGISNCLKDGIQSDIPDFPLGDAAQAWSISRGKMRWEFHWTFSDSSRLLRGYEAGCSPPVRPPRELVGSDELGVGWNQVLAKVPDAQTAFAAPDRSLLLVFTGSQILALKREGAGLGAPFTRVFVRTTDVVAGQWAVGRFADEWERQLSQAESWIDQGQRDKR